MNNNIQLKGFGETWKQVFKHFLNWLIVTELFTGISVLEHHLIVLFQKRVVFLTKLQHGTILNTRVWGVHKRTFWNKDTSFTFTF